MELLTVHFNRVQGGHCYALLSIMYDAIGVDKIDDIWVVLAGSEDEREEILVKAHRGLSA